MQAAQRVDDATLAKMLASASFARSERMCRFLRLLVERANQEGCERIKETEIGALVFDRDVGYDPKIDSIVRTEATRLRRKLSEYYAGEGSTDPYRLRLPPGRYELEIVPNSSPETIAVLVAPETTHASAAPLLPRYWYGVVAIAFVGVVIVLLRIRRETPASQALEAVPFTFFEGVENQPAFSPDGKTVAYTWDGENQGSPAVYTQLVASSTPKRVTNSPDKEYRPVWSPNGDEIAFLRRTEDAVFELRIHKLHASPETGSAETLVARLPARPGTVPGLSWSPDGAWLLTAAPRDSSEHLALLVISPHTREQRFLPRQDPSLSYLHAAFSHDGRHIAYVKAPEVAVNDVFVAGFPEGPEHQITSDRAPVYGLAWNAADTALIISTQRVSGRWSLWRFPLNNHQPSRLTEAGQESIYPALSSAGDMLAFSRRMDNINIWIRTLSTTDVPPSAPSPTGPAPTGPWIASSGLNSSPQFSPDGKEVAFRSDRSGPNEVWVAQADGQVRQITHIGGPLTGSPSWSPDGKWLAYDSRIGGKAHIWIVAAAGGQPRRLTQEDGTEVVSSWSRDGKFVYYNTDRSGRWSVWRSPLIGTAGAQLVREGAFAGKESADGYLYYVRGPNQKGLFRARLPDGAEEPVLPEFPAGMWGSWALGRTNLYFIDRLDKPSREAWAQVRDSSGQVRRLFMIGAPVGWDGALAISPDEKRIAYAQLDRSGSDLFLVKNLK